MDSYAIALERRMAAAARQLHETADGLVTYLESSAEMQRVLKLDNVAGDNARAALENARKWRARMEQGE